MLYQNLIGVKQFVLLILFLTAAINTFSQKPNIIYMMTDDMGYADLSCYGRKDYKTPNLDKLSSEGMMFTNAYAAAPVCTPTRAALMTGKYPASTSVGLNEPIKNTKLDSTKGLTPDDPSIATRLSAAGYETYLIGKWHLGYQPQNSPLSNGFQHFFGFKSGAVDYISHAGAFNSHHDLYENNKEVFKEGYMTDILLDKTLEVLSAHHEKPFFLSLMFNAPHWPWQAPGDKPYADTMDWRRGGSQEVYAAMMTSLDNAVGKIMKAIENNDLSENTIIIFTSDNGGERFSDMGIYKGRKMQLWEGGIRVPAFVKWPGKIKPGSKTNQVATTMDWTATILSLAGIQNLNDLNLDGLNLLPVLLEQSEPIERTLFWRVSQHNQNKAIRSGKWKYLQDEKGNEYLFDLESDPSESNNLAQKETEIYKRLTQQYAEWESKMLKPLSADE